MTVIYRGSHRGAAPDVPAEQPLYWAEAAACVGEDPEMFFPKGGASVRLANALAVCERCPVRVECLQDALDRQIDYGVRGGVSEEARRAIHGRAPIGGTRAGLADRAEMIAADPEEYLRMVSDGLSAHRIAMALRTNIPTIHQVARLIAAQEQGAQAPGEERA